MKNLLFSVVGAGIDADVAETEERAQTYLSSSRIDVGEGWEQITDLKQAGQTGYVYEFTTDGGETWTSEPPAGVNPDGTQKDLRIGNFLKGFSIL